MTDLIVWTLKAIAASVGCVLVIGALMAARYVVEARDEDAEAERRNEDMSIWRDGR
jgi:hypothetical protein